ncbi:ParB/Srx family N-terminal domain-containing protein [Riemerella columbina]|uniref:ParB/Srx family N-terminal domain-containing protein n=1 Tax=Riemerella columbina TaxID=103810 RepID=UPI000370615F|nr:ParB/Srx family N-terminal domain-containing protein [Riemerella columbina]
MTLRDFAEDLTEDPADRKDFFELVKSIVKTDFVPADPVVVWKDEENGKYYVAEGNRRLVALKLLRNPDKAPKSIRSFIRKQSNKYDLSKIEKIYVNVAPSFEEAEWYINQRNSSSSLQRKWTRIQQQRWINSLYDKYGGDLDKILSITKMDKSELEGFIRILKIRDFIKNPKVKNELTDEEFEKANSYKFPITILERIFNFTDTREKWGIEYNGTDVNIISNKSSFFKLFSELIKRIVNKTDGNINTRINKEHLPAIFDSLPEVTFEPNEENPIEISDDKVDNNDDKVEPIESFTKSDTPKDDKPAIKEKDLKGDPNRNRVLLSIYKLKTDSYKLHKLFEEFKVIPTNKYPNHISAAFRVFLDLAVLKFIETEGLESEICSQYKSGLKEITLKKRLEFIKAGKANNEIKIKINKLLDPSQEFTLDVLNGYIHGQDSHYTEKKFLNRFWDFLFPIFNFLLDIKEEDK